MREQKKVRGGNEKIKERRGGEKKKNIGRIRRKEGKERVKRNGLPSTWTVTPESKGPLPAGWSQPRKLSLLLLLIHIQQLSTTPWAPSSSNCAHPMQTPMESIAHIHHFISTTQQKQKPLCQSALHWTRHIIPSLPLTSIFPAIV